MASRFALLLLPPTATRTVLAVSLVTAILVILVLLLLQVITEIFLLFDLVTLLLLLFVVLPFASDVSISSLRAAATVTRFAHA